jgi:hypothetical protein
VRDGADNVEHAVGEHEEADPCGQHET